MIFQIKSNNLNIKKCFILKAWIFILIFFIISINVKAQYFGRNKPSYKNFEFKVYTTPNFEIYHYLDNDSLLDQLARACEEWYKLHERIFNDSIKDRNPVIFYENHADFQQTTAIMGQVGVGTGGVTEALKNRVIMPVAPTSSQTDHVLGHELVHAFQYNSIIRGDSTNMNSLRNIPLWMVEGMAEYLSIGSVDEHTAMWMRDAVLNDDFPTLKEMTRNQKYFPYRYGHAFWAFVAKTWGDTIIVPLFVETAKVGYEEAIKSKIGLTAETFSGMWKLAMEKYYTGIMTDTIDNPTGKKILFPGNAGDMNLSPSISPDGQYVVFLSERDVLSLDLFLAKAEDGKIIKKLSSTIHRNEIDALNYLESAGTWSPDSKKFAFSAFEKGKNKLLIIDIENGRLVEEFNIPGILSFNNPAWSPDGESIVISGMVNGTNNLYRFYMTENRVEQITNDRYSYIQPSFSPDGKYLVFATDREPDGADDSNTTFYIGIIDLEEKNNVRVLPVFYGADNFNPVFSSDGESVYFLSNRDGFRNLYRFHPETEKTYQMTKYMTGISGITHYSPAISVARNMDRISYSYYYNGKYSIYRAESTDFEELEVSSDSLDFRAAILPPAELINPNLVDKKLSHRESYKEIEKEKYEIGVYQPKFKLDYISNITAGVSSNRFSTGMAGSVFAIFSDIVGKNQLYTTLAVNGEIYDFGGQFAYMNQAKKINWGASISHVPYQYATAFLTVDTLGNEEEPIIVDDLVMDQMRIFEDQISAFAYFPFSTTRRVEFGVSQSWYYYRINRWHSYYDLYRRLIGQSKEKLDAPDGFNIRKLDAAFVTDNSIFGYASPLQGSRSRFQIEKYFGEIDFFTALVDYRKYFRMRPFTLAARIYHYGRYGSTDSRILSPLYLGYPWYIRGYDNNKIYEMMDYEEVQEAINQLYGDKIVVANLELRFPFTGPERLSLIKSKLLFTELCLFLDAGLAWYDFEDISFDYRADGRDLRMPVYSAGASFRVNIFGAIILEPYYVFPFRDDGIQKGVLGLNFIPGW